MKMHVLLRSFSAQAMPPKRVKTAAALQEKANAAVEEAKTKTKTEASLNCRFSGNMKTNSHQCPYDKSVL